MYRTSKLDNSNKVRFYERLNEELLELIEFEDEGLASLANAAALLGHQLDHINWAGFYLLKKDILVLGPFQGKPACSAIVVGNGVCGTSAAEQQTILVPDVHDFPGHIACDEASQSEIVVPIIKDGVLKGVLDIDSPVKNRFSLEDKDGLEQFAALLAKYVKWESLIP